MLLRVALFVVAMVLTALPLTGRAIDPLQFGTPELRERYQALTEQLRCPKCQNQDLADSNAPIASDLRHEIHRLLEKGYTDQQIRDHLVDRYGEFILYKPRFSRDTALLWLLPAVSLLAGVAVIVGILIRRSRAAAVEDVALSDAERSRLADLLDKNQGGHQ